MSRCAVPNADLPARSSRRNLRSLGADGNCSQIIRVAELGNELARTKIDNPDLSIIASHGYVAVIRHQFELDSRTPEGKAISRCSCRDRGSKTINCRGSFAAGLPQTISAVPSRE